MITLNNTLAPSFITDNNGPWHRLCSCLYSIWHATTH